MMKSIKFIGLDVHAATVAIAVAEMGGEVRSLGIVKHELGAIRRVLGKLGTKEQLRVCYEAGPTGFALFWELTQLGIECMVVAPSLIPKAASDRVKTDRRDAQKLARAHGAGDLTADWVPDQKQKRSDTWWLWARKVRMPHAEKEVTRAELGLAVLPPRTTWAGYDYRPPLPKRVNQRRP